MSLSGPMYCFVINFSSSEQYSLIVLPPMSVLVPYCKFGNFREKFIFLNSVKSHIYHVKNLRLGHDLPALVNDKVISTFRMGIIFTKLHL